MTRVVVIFLLLVSINCGVYYTFDKNKLGTSLPNYLQTVEIPLFSNQSLQPDVAEDITRELSDRVVNENILTNVARDGDATITGKVLSYSNSPHTYGSEGYRNVNVSEYVVAISVKVTFMDNKKNKPLYDGVVSAEGIYDFQSESEEAGRNKAIKDVVDQILQNSIQSW